MERVLERCVGVEGIAERKKKDGLFKAHRFREEPSNTVLSLFTPPFHLEKLQLPHSRRMGGGWARLGGFFGPAWGGIGVHFAGRG